ncbi:MAG: PEP/pyruvate-binding domain-containing protein [Acidobacteriota bacterium]
MSDRIVHFSRDSFGPDQPFTVIGKGELGGKAQGLAFIQRTLADRLGPGQTAGIRVAIPTLTVVTTSLFDTFVGHNQLGAMEASGLPDDRIARAFLRAELPVELVGDLWALIDRARGPLAVRSSSLLEDIAGRPLAGVYATKMIPNSEPDPDARFRQLVEAIKLVWASTYFEEARTYRSTVGSDDEHMGVIVQEVVGLGHGQRFYPNVSGVARSINYYPSGYARPEDGVVELALGLGKWIVDGEPVWGYSPAFPKAPPPFNDLNEMLRFTQNAFWAINLGTAPYDPAKETEYMLRCELAAAEADDTVRYVGSTFDPQSGRLAPGVSRKGPRLINFAPLLQYGVAPVNDALRAVLAACEDATGGPVEIEFALTLDQLGEAPAHLGFLQVRPLVAPGEVCEVGEEELGADRVLVASDHALGNGQLDDIRDVVYVRPDRFDPARSPAVAAEIGALNETLRRGSRPYLLVGFGRWGTSDPWAGVPVKWAQISGARAIVEAQLPEVRPELSQGSHFFHNLTSFGVLYLSVGHRGPYRVKWSWLDGQAAEGESMHLRHVRLAHPLTIRVDGRTGRGVITHD